MDERGGLRMAIEWDDLHYSFREIDGYNKPFNFVMSPREPGKTTAMWFKKIYCNWKKKHKPWYYLVRYVVEITDTLIDDIANTYINKFSDDNVKLQYKSGDLKGGIVDVFIEGQIFLRICALSCKLRKLKLAILQDAEGAFMDEYIIDPSTGEKYLQGEAFKLKEVYTTWRRGYTGTGIFKFYFCANPYSLFNPLFVDWKVEVNQLKRDSFYVGKFFVIHWAILNPKLRAMLLEKNPFYKFDEDYANYAVEGQATQDANIKIGALPEGYKLQFVFLYDKIKIGIYRNYTEDIELDKFYAKEIKNEGYSKAIYCVDFADMINGSILLGNEDRLRLKIFKNAIRTRQITFENINLYYILKEVYSYL